MAVSVTKITSGHLGPLKAFVGTVTFDSSYVTAGEPVVASDFGLTTILAVFCGSASAEAGTVGGVVRYDKTNSKLQVFETGTGDTAPLAEVTSADNLSTYIVDVLVIGH